MHFTGYYIYFILFIYLFIYLFKCSFYSSFNVFNVLIEDAVVTSPTGNGTVAIIGHPSHAKVQPFVGQRPYSRLHFWGILTYGPVPGIESALSRSAVKRYIGWASPAVVFIYLFIFFSGNRKPVQDVWFVDEPIIVQHYSSGSIVSFLRSHVWSVGLQTKGTISKNLVLFHFK